MSKKSLFWLSFAFILLGACSDVGGNELTIEKNGGVTEDCNDSRSDIDFCNSLNVECGQASGNNACGALREVENCGLCDPYKICDNGLCHESNLSNPVTVEIVIFSGVPNPTFELEVSDVLNIFAPYCKQISAVTSSCESIYGHLNYREIRIYHEKLMPDQIIVSNGCILFKKGPDPVACQNQMEAVTSDLLSSPDTDFSLERALIDMAYQKKAISESLRDFIFDSINSR